MRKLQSSIEKFILSAIIALVAIIVSYFIYSSFYSTSSHIGLKSYLVHADFSNIYGNKTSIFILLKNNTEIGNNVLINERITFSNGTSNSITIPFTLKVSSQSGNGYLYYFSTSNFPAIANNSQGIKISNINILSGNSIIESQNKSIVYTSYYYTKSSLATVPLYYLNMSTSIINAGVLTPGNGYYYAGSKVAIGEKPNTGYAFAGWLGYGNGNYTGTNQTSVIIMNSNITEYARYTKLVKMHVNATYNGIPVYVNSVLNTTTNGTIYLAPETKYTLSVPMYVSISSGERYLFTNLQDDCGISVSPNSNSTTFVPSYANYNCKFTANYVEQYYLTMLSSNTTRGTVSPYSGWYSKGSSVEINAIPRSLYYTFSKWEGSGAGSYGGTNNQTNIIINGPISEEAFFKKFIPFLFITIFNNESVPTPKPFQQMITFNASSYSQYENYNLGNIRFYQGSTELYSWCESGCSNTSSNAVFWIKLPNGINKNSNTIINMTFEQKSTNYDGNYTGEAPQLSPTYGEYDNGANVFNFYDDFKGTTLSSVWTVPSGSNYQVNNGFIATPSGGSTTAVYNPNIQETSSIIVEWCLNMSSTPSYPINHLFLNYYSFRSNMHWLEALSSGGVDDLFSNNGETVVVTSNNIEEGGIIPISSTGIQVFGIWNGGTTVTWYYDGNSYTDTSATAVTDYLALGWVYYYDYSYNFPTIYWVRTRAYPPNGVMPSVSFGKIHQS